MTFSFFLPFALAALQVKQDPQLFQQKVSASDPLRAEQVKELESYMRAMSADKSRLNALFKPDYSSIRAYEKSKQNLRQRFAESIGYPPPGGPITEKESLVLIGEDSIGTYFRARFPVVPGITAEGIYITPKGTKGKLPLVISMHGGGGSPEVALFNGGANYHDMVRGGVKRGYAVFAPQHLFYAPGYDKDIRRQIDSRLRFVGTSISAVEIAKISRSLDYLLKRPEIDATRVAMVGLSYGGYYALVTPALEPRIKVTVSSCYFGIQEWRHENEPPSIGTDFNFSNRLTLFRDSETAALICPRPMLIQAGKKDDDAHRAMGVQLAPGVADMYKKLGRGADFEFLVFEGGHEFHDESAWAFLKKHL